MISPRLRLAILLTVAALAGLATCVFADDDRTAELERKVDALSRTLEAMQLGGAADTAATVSRFGLAPAAAKIYGATHGTSVGGYGEMLFEKPDRTREDDALSGASPSLDLLRAVFYVGHKFTDDLLFNSEIEWEHGGIVDEAEVEVDPLSGEGEAELSGEVVVEFAYLDWRLQPAFGIRGGMLLVPMGFLNEMHEPPVFYGARRPDVERLIIPATWSANGAGFYGEIGNALAWRAYVVEGLDARGFRAASGIRGGRQGGSQSVLTHPALTGRLDWVGGGALLAGVSAFTGDAWQSPQSGETRRARTTLIDAHARLAWRGLEARALYAGGAIDNAGTLSAALDAGSDPIGDRFWGGYVEAAYDVMPLLRAGSRFSFTPYARYEELDTQDEGLAPGVENPALHQKIVTAGVAFKPHPEVVLKLDRQQRRNDADTATSAWNVALGYLF